MEQVTGSIRWETVGGNIITDLVTNSQSLNDLEFDDQTIQILNHIQLNSQSTVLSGLFLLELYYNKTYGKPLATKHICKPNPLNICVFGTEENIIESTNKIIEQIDKINNFGSMCFEIKKINQLRIINYVIEKYSRQINIYCFDCKDPNELMEFFDSGNEMIYWAHDTGLVVSPYAKFGMKLNQVVPNKTCKDIPNQKLYELKLIGFDISNYINSTCFVNSIGPVAFPQNILSSNNFYKKLDEKMIKFHIITKDEFKKPSFTDLDSSNEQLIFNYISCISKFIMYPMNKATDYNSIVLTGLFKQVIQLDYGICVVLAILDSDFANKLKNIIKKCVDYSNYKNLNLVETFLVDSNYLKEEDKYLLKPNNQIFKQLKNYSNEDQLIIACILNNNLGIVDTNNKLLISDWGYFL